MTLTREGMLVGIAAVGLALCAPAVARSAPSHSAPAIVAQVTAAPLLAGTPEPTEEPTTPASDALVAAAAVGPEWNAFAQLVVGANDFIEIVHSKQSREGMQFDKTFKFWARKPTYARCEIIDGDGKGGVVVWRGGTKVQAHEGGEHAAIVVVLPRHNKNLVDLMGYGCGDVSPDNILGYTTHNGKLSEAPGPTIDGQATDDVTWIVNPGDAVYLTRAEFFISKTTHLLIATHGFHGDTQVEDSTWQITVNPGVKFSTFDIDTNI
jgi:hypothetical protein